MFKKVISSSITLLMIFIISPLAFPSVFSQEGTLLASMSGGDYKIITDSLNSGGGELSESANFILSDTIGEVGSGESNSANYRILAGYRQMQDSFLSISSEADLNLASIGGVSGGESSGTVGWTVTTDNPAGYQMSVKSDSEPSMQSTGNLYSFQDYYPRGADYGALDFNGSNDYVDIPNFTTEIANLPQNDFSVSLWALKPTDSGLPAAISFGIPGNWSNDLFIIYVGETNQGIRVWWDGGSVISYGQSIASPDWQHVTMTKTGNNFEVFLNGNSIATGSRSGSWTSTSLSIGAANNNGSMTQFYQDQLDDVRIYNKALSANEVALLHKGKNITDGLAGHWKLDDGSGTTALDSSGNGNSGTLYGTPDWTTYQLNPTYNFDILNIQSAFGISPEGTHIVDRFKDNGSACATGSLDTAAKCWVGLSTDDVTVSQSFSSTQPDGAETVLRFRAASGASNIQPAANYSSTITVTAIPQ